MPYNPAIEVTPYNAPRRAAWHVEGLRWIAGLFTSAADRLESTQETPVLALEPTPPQYRPFDEFLYDVRFRVQHEMFLR